MSVSPDEMIRVALKGEPVESLDVSIRTAIERAEEQADRGEGMPLDEAFERLRSSLDTGL